MRSVHVVFLSHRLSTWTRVKWKYAKPSLRLPVLDASFFPHHLHAFHMLSLGIFFWRSKFQTKNFRSVVGIIFQKKDLKCRHRLSGSTAGLITPSHPLWPYCVKHCHTFHQVEWYTTKSTFFTKANRKRFTFIPSIHPHDLTLVRL